MGAYVDLTARPGCEEQINQAYALCVGRPDAWLVYSRGIIETEIAYVHSEAAPKDQHHMRVWLHTVEDWEKALPTLKVGMGQIKVSRGLSTDEESAAEEAEIRRDMKFVLDHRFLFSTVTGLDDARRYGLTEATSEQLENGHGRPRPQEDELSFASLPHSATQLYKLCVQYGRPDLWAAYLGYRDAQSTETWEELRCKCIPWLGAVSLAGPTVWQRTEELATAQDGRDFGLQGRFRDGNFPALFLLRQAMAPTVTVAA